MKKRSFTLVVLILGLMVPLASATVVYLLSSSMSGTIAEPTVQFTSGSDTSSISGTIGNNGSSFTATGLPLIAGVQCTVDQAVNITNTDGSNSKQINLELASEDFGSECTQITVYLVKPDGTEITAVVIDDSGAATTSASGWQTIAASATWAIKIVTQMDAGAAAAAKTLSLNLSWK